MSQKNVEIIPVTEEERKGLTSEEADARIEKYGFNELPVVEISLFRLFFLQFTGLMPYMLEVACILALGVQDYIDFVIIFVIILSNGILGFTEEMKAKKSLDELTAKMEAVVPCLRNGKAETLSTRELVPGDVILLCGGTSVPADVDWCDGDVLAIDTAALTGEPLPRKYPSDEYGNTILAGTIVSAGEAYCIVRKTGINTEVGGAQAEIMQDKTKTKISVFEDKVLNAVKVLISIACVDVFIIFFVLGLGRGEFNNGETDTVLLTSLSIIIASVPVALPLVLQVTMALGAGKMARDFSAVVTSLPALQDISSMTILCSDKTGTLTTAKMTIIDEALWVNEGFTKDELALYSALGSNRDKKDDAIDKAVINYFDKFGSLKDEYSTYTKVRNVGFNPIYKRVLWEYTDSKGTVVTIAKGLVNKVINTEAGSPDDAEDQWKVENWEKLSKVAGDVDFNYSKTGYKTLGVSVKIGKGNFQFVGILPMLDPPRHDTQATINNLIAAGIKVKMITGDHLNIAKETARLIGMKTNIHKGEETRVQNQVTNELIWNADGFAQVLPKDKREVVLVLKNHFKQVVGMTGDGVNDAPALSAAQCGVAVDDATDAAKNAAAIILTSPGLSAIYMAVLESRKIFRKLKSYVTYRFAATVQILLVLSILIYESNCTLDSLYIILLALFNDLSMLPVAYDAQVASKNPEVPLVHKMLGLATVLGTVQTMLTLLFAYGSEGTTLFNSRTPVEDCPKYTQSIIWVEMFLTTEFLIFSTRAANFAILSPAPSSLLLISVVLFCLLVSILACATDYFGGIAVKDCVYVWIWSFFSFAVSDCAKMLYYHFTDESSEIIDESKLKFIDQKSEVNDEVELLIGSEDSMESGVTSKSKASSGKRKMGSNSITAPLSSHYNIGMGSLRMSRHTSIRPNVPSSLTSKFH